MRVAYAFQCRLVTILVVALAVSGHLACSQQAASPRSVDLAEMTARFQARLDMLREEAGFPGATAAFVLADGTLAIVSTGLADSEANEPMPINARMPAGSVGKTFVAATALALVKEGKLALDEKVSTWLGDEPWFDGLPNAPDITLRMLLTHSSGLPDHIKDPRLGERLQELRVADENGEEDPDWYLKPRQAVGMLVGKPALFPAGTSFSYTDTGYILVGLIIEKVAGSGYYDEVGRRFLGPLRLDLTVPSDRRAIPGLVPGYTGPDNPLALTPKSTVDGVLTFNPATEYTGGGMASNPGDLARWAKELYEERAMAGPYLEDLLSSVEWVGAAGTRYGLGVIIRESPLGTHYGHSGWYPGYVSRVLYFPEERVAVAVQVNTDIGQDVTAHALALAEVILPTVTSSEAR